MTEPNFTLSEAGLSLKEINLLLRFRAMNETEKKFFMSLIDRKAFQTDEEIFLFLDFAEERGLPLNEALPLFPELGGAS